MYTYVCTWLYLTAAIHFSPVGLHGCALLMVYVHAIGNYIPYMIATIIIIVMCNSGDISIYRDMKFHIVI